jgi:hypothetical protein
LPQPGQGNGWVEPDSVMFARQYGQVIDRGGVCAGW